MNLDAYLQTQAYFNILIYGVAGTRKTWWAGTAAEAGHPVLILDCDSKLGILRQLTPAARARVFAINIADVANAATAKDFMAFFLKRQPLFLGLHSRKVTSNAFFLKDEPCMEVNINSILQIPGLFMVLDSWTALVWSIMRAYALKQNIDMSDADKPEWDGYGWTGRLATWVLNEWKALPCHKIMVAHQTMYEKKKEIAAGNRTQTVTEWQRRQVVSTSNPHGMTVAKLFTDVVWASQVAMAPRFSIDADANGDSLCTLIPHNGGQQYTWEQFVWPALEQTMGIQPHVHAEQFPALPLIEPGQAQQPAQGMTRAELISAPSGVIRPQNTAAAILNPTGA